MPERSKLLAAEWAGLSDEAKLPFVDQAKVLVGFGLVFLFCGRLGCCLPQPSSSVTLPIPLSAFPPATCLQELKKQLKAAPAAAAEGVEEASAPKAQKKRKAASGSGGGGKRGKGAAGVGGGRRWRS